MAAFYPKELDSCKTYSDVARTLSKLEWAAREKDDGWTYSDFNMEPMVERWIKEHRLEAQMLAFEHGVAGSHRPPYAREVVAAAHAGEKTIDHSTGKEVETPQFAALHGW